MRLISSAPISAVTGRSPACPAIFLSPSCHVYGARPGYPARAHALTASAVHAGQHVIGDRPCHLLIPLAGMPSSGLLTLRAPRSLANQVNSLQLHDYSG